MVRLDNKISESKFVKTLLIKIKDIYARQLILYINTETRPDIPFNEYGNEKEKLLKKIFKRYTNLIGHCEKLVNITKYLDNKTIKEFCDSNEINEVDYYQYHFENFIIRLVSILDLCSKIGNELYELGISERDCNWYKFSHHSEIIGKKCCTIILSYSDYLSSLRLDRNLIVHTGGYESDKITTIESKIFDENLLSDQNIIKEWFDNQKNEEISRMVDFINNNIENALKYLFDFLDSMDPDLKNK
jgi:hypothetical protein